MSPGDEIQVYCGNTIKTVMVAGVSRGRVVVTWPLIGEYDVDLVTGELFEPPGPARGVFSVDIARGRVLGTRTSVVVDHLLRLATLQVGDTVQLDNGARAEVVDAVPSEGTLKIYVHSSGGRSGVWRMGSLRTSYRVSEAMLQQMRAAAGCISALAS